jgi:ankyrin repeat protein
MAVSPQINVNRTIFDATRKKLIENEAQSQEIIEAIIGETITGARRQRVIKGLRPDFGKDGRPEKKITARSMIGRVLQYIVHKTDDFFSITGDASLMLQYLKFMVRAELENPMVRAELENPNDHNLYHKKEGLWRFWLLLFLAAVSGLKFVTDLTIGAAVIKHAIFDYLGKKFLRTKTPEERKPDQSHSEIPDMEEDDEVSFQDSKINRNLPNSANFRLFSFVSSKVVASEEEANNVLKKLFDEDEANLHARDSAVLNNSILLWGIANANVNTTVYYLKYIKEKFPKEEWLAEVNHAGKNDLTPLHLAIYKGWDHEDGIKGKMSEIIKELVACPGIDINAQDQYGNTPLHIALMRRDYECAFFLLNNGAAVSLDIQNKDQLTPGDMFSMNYNDVTSICRKACSVSTMQDPTKFAQSIPKETEIETKEEEEVKHFSLGLRTPQDAIYDKVITFILNGSKQFAKDIQKLKGFNSLTKGSFTRVIYKYFGFVPITVPEIDIKTLQD